MIGVLHKMCIPSYNSAHNISTLLLAFYGLTVKNSITIYYINTFIKNNKFNFANEISL